MAEKPRSKLRLAVDVGGTFTDFVLLDDDSGEVQIEKVPSGAEDPGSRILQGIELLGIQPGMLSTIVHGATVAINAMIQGRGAKVGLITTEGFRDVLELGRGNRAEMYNLYYDQPKPLVPRHLRVEAPERINFKGEVLLPLDEEATRKAVGRLKEKGVEAIAVCLIHAYANPLHELKVREIIAQEYPGTLVSLSHEVAGQWYEYERTSTVVVNSYLVPTMDRYLGGIDEHLQAGGFDGRLSIMQSTGGVMTVNEARAYPVRTLQSGPAGGVIGSARLAEALGLRNVICGDVGGTSFDVGLILDGQPVHTSQTQVDSRPLLTPTIEINSIGAGGGSIAWLDKVKALHVGPQSAEAEPGPACYGKGGTEPTVTDAQVVLGRINPYNFLGNRMPLDVEAAQGAITSRIADPLGMSLVDAAAGVAHLADMNMTYAIRKLTVERGYDPRDFALFCYGGAGGLEVGVLMRELEIPTGIVPRYPANFSAWGLLNTDLQHHVVRTLVQSLEEASASLLEEIFEELESACVQTLQGMGSVRSGIRVARSCDMRYVGQEHTINVPLGEGFDKKEIKRQFDELHDKYYAHSSPDHPAEMINYRVGGVGLLSKPRMKQMGKGLDAAKALKGEREVWFTETGGYVPTRIYERERLAAGLSIEGPAIVEEWTSTTVVHPAQVLEADSYGNLVLHSR
jgi:N-methylhydantoinase A